MRTVFTTKGIAARKINALAKGRRSRVEQSRQARSWVGYEQRARPEQLIPSFDGAYWFVWLMLCGRGWGKTWTGASAINHLVTTGRIHAPAIIGRTAHDVRAYQIEGPSGLLATAPPWNRPRYYPSKREVRWPNGAKAHIYYAEEPEGIRGPNHDSAWGDEPATWKDAKLGMIDVEGTAWSNLLMTLRIGERPFVILTGTPRPVKLIRELVKQPDTRLIVRPTWDNEANLTPTFLEKVIAPYRGTRLGRQELEAALLEDVPGALWTSHMIERSRISPEFFKERIVKKNRLKRVAIGVDPSVSGGEGADEAGIIVAAQDLNDDYYVIKDASGQMHPTQWADATVREYWSMNADYIIAEANQGGDMVALTIEQHQRNAPVKLVHASRGKVTRAQPVSMLYEQNRVHHVGAFADLEEQMTTWEAGDPDSPDRMDALVWVLTDLAMGSGLLEVGG